MQDPNEDTEWNDILRAKGIIPEKPKENEIQEEDIIAMMDAAIKEKSGGQSSFFQKVLFLIHQNSNFTGRTFNEFFPNRPWCQVGPRSHKVAPCEPSRPL